MNELIDAINHRLVVEFTYDGLPRKVIPTAVGQHATTRNAVLRGYQVDGLSKTRPVPLWDLFLLTKIVGLRVTKERFADDPPGYRKGDKHISPRYTEL